MTARCGSNDPAHRSKGCAACDRIYKKRYKDGAPKFRVRMRADAARCVVCGLVAGNLAGVPVYRYPLKRWHRKQSLWIGTVGLCDPCIAEQGELREPFRRAA